MSKFTRIINTFKNGLVSPRLRGAVTSPESGSSAEILDNFIIDKTGSAIKRPGLILDKRESIGLTNYQFFSYSFENKKYILRFDKNKSFNSVDANFNSNYLTVFEDQIPNTSNYKVGVFGKGPTPIDILSWSYSNYTITLTVASGHGVNAGDVISVSGLACSTNAPNNSSCTVTAVTATTITYSALFPIILNPISWAYYNINQPPFNFASTAIWVTCTSSSTAVVGDYVTMTGFTGVTGTTSPNLTNYPISNITTDVNGNKVIQFNLGSNTFSGTPGLTNPTMVFYGKPTGTPTVSGAKFESSISTIGSSAALWSHTYSATGELIESGLNNYLDKPYMEIIQSRKISEDTVVFTTANHFSFLLTLFNYETNTDTKKVFFLYPYFVSRELFKLNLGKNRSDSVKCPIVPSNFPFEDININQTTPITTSVVVSITSQNQSGSLTSSGIISKSNERFIYVVTIPKKSITINGSYINLEGRFISVPSADGTKDVVFFLTKEYSWGSTSVSYLAIQCIGGVASTSSTQWKLSTWGEDNHPRVVGLCFQRLMYANTKKQPSKWWSSAIHPNNVKYIQGFMQKNLLQDTGSSESAADVSGLGYNGISLASLSTSTNRTSISDINRFGFSDNVPNYGDIYWIRSKRNIHFGTSLGECQSTIPSGNYSLMTYTQNIVSSIQSSFYESVEGDRKIFYISANGEEIRGISTEDKDYESVDISYTDTIHGLNIRFKKLEWLEKLRILLCLDTNNNMYALTIHRDTNIKAISKFVFSKEILDFTKDTIILKDSNYIYSTRISNIEDSFYGDLFNYSVGSVPDLTNYWGKTINVYCEGSKDTVELPAVEESITSFPFYDIDNPKSIYIWEDTYTSKFKSLPIHEGAKFGSSVGDVQRVDRISLLLDNSSSFYYGSELDKLISSEGMGLADTKIVTVDFPQSPDREQFIYIESSDPTPLNISGISLRGVSYSGE